MSNVLIDREKIDILANAISDKSGVPVTMTLDEMVEAVDGIEANPAPTLQAKTYTVDSAGTATVTADSGYDGLSSVSVSVPQGEMYAGVVTGFFTENGIRKWAYQGYAAIESGDAYGTEGYIADHTVEYGSENICNAIAKNTSITPTESTQTIGGVNYHMEGAVTVNAIPSNYVGSGITQRSSSDLTASGATVTVPSGYYSSNASKAVASGTEGTPTATKGTVSNHQVSVTPSVTNTAGYISGGTKNGTAVTVSASELVSGTYTVDSSGSKDVTNYASASVPSVESALSVDSYGEFTTESGQRKWTNYVYADSDGVSGWFNGNLNHTVTKVYNAVPANTTITPTISSQTIGGSNYMMEGAVTVSGDQNLSASNIKKNVSIFGVTGTYEGGGGSSMQIGNLDGAATSTSSISFTGLQGEPTAFSFMIDASVATGTPSKIVAVVFDGTSLHAQTITNTANAQVTYDSTSLSKTYSNGTLTITSNGPSFVLDYYYGVYTYSGGAVDTKDVQVGSGATSITFTGLEDEPAWWSCIFKSNFSTSSGYQRVIYVAKGNTTTNVSGLEMDSGAHNAVHWTASYNSGSFTITSQGTNAGGYFHQPGYYQLTYAYDDGSGGNYQSKTVTPTTSQQVIEADSGYDALKKVTVNAIPSEYIVPSGNINITSNTATGQTLNVAQYATATVAVPTGGGSANIATATMTNSSNQNTTISFTLPSGRTPKAFFARLTSQIARSSNSRYYYVFDMRWDGSNTGGVAGNTFYMYSGTLTNVTSGYSYSQSGTTFTLSSTGSRSASPGSFYNGTYELVYIY